MVIDGADPFAAAKPDARLIKLLLRRAGSEHGHSPTAKVFSLPHSPRGKVSAGPLRTQPVHLGVGTPCTTRSGARRPQQCRQGPVSTGARQED